MQIFIDNVTLIDCAILLPTGPEGKSWYVDIVWEGEKDADGFLLDFSQAKKTAKMVIDKEFDHKLFVQPEQIRLNSTTQTVIIEKNFALNTYPDAIKKINLEMILDLAQGNVALLEREIAHAILKNSAENITNVFVTLKENSQHRAPNYFSYTHSLCFHSGNCQRFHGHSNIVEIYKGGKCDPLASATAALKLKNFYIVAQSYLKEEWDNSAIQEMLAVAPEFEHLKNELVAIQYQGVQGETALIFPRKNILVLNCESTVENLAEYIKSQFAADEEIVVKLYEGLSKGALV